jgi:prolyl-tRNA editing enzyme YbaK/EbsC (Cys-tRNA(Pro) deacylase)
MRLRGRADRQIARVRRRRRGDDGALRRGPAGDGARRRPATADEARAATGFAIGGIPPLGHDTDLPTVVDESLGRFERVWCAAGTPHAVFETRVDDLLAALPGATVRPV